MTLKSKGGSSLRNAIMMLAGFAILAFASTCFKEVPLIGTVFLMPGHSILTAKIVDPVLHYGLFLLGGAFTALGLLLQLKIGFGDASTEPTRPSAEERSLRPTSFPSTVINLSQIKEAKGLLDAGAISEEEFHQIKAKLIKQTS